MTWKGGNCAHWSSGSGEGASAPYLPLPFREITCGCVPKFRELRYPRRHFPGKVYEWDVLVTWPCSRGRKNARCAGSFYAPGRLSPPGWPPDQINPCISQCSVAAAVAKLSRSDQWNVSQTWGAWGLDKALWRVTRPGEPFAPPCCLRFTAWDMDATALTAEVTLHHLDGSHRLTMTDGCR